jgi:hypothetical protein
MSRAGKEISTRAPASFASVTAGGGSFGTSRLRTGRVSSVGVSNERLLAVLDRWRAGKASADGRREALDVCVLLGVVGVQSGDRSFPPTAAVFPTTGSGREDLPGGSLYEAVTSAAGEPTGELDQKHLQIGSVEAVSKTVIRR